MHTRVKDVFQYTPSNHIKQELCHVQTITYARMTMVYIYDKSNKGGCFTSSYTNETCILYLCCQICNEVQASCTFGSIGTICMYAKNYGKSDIIVKMGLKTVQHSFFSDNREV